MRDAGVKLNRVKSEINVFKPPEERILSIRNFRCQEPVEETECFLGLINYVLRFIPNLSTSAEPLKRIIKQSNKFE